MRTSVAWATVGVVLSIAGACGNGNRGPSPIAPPSPAPTPTTPPEPAPTGWTWAFMGYVPSFVAGIEPRETLLPIADDSELDRSDPVVVRDGERVVYLDLTAARGRTLLSSLRTEPVTVRVSGRHACELADRHLATPLGVEPSGPFTAEQWRCVGRLAPIAMVTEDVAPFRAWVAGGAISIPASVRVWVMQVGSFGPEQSAAIRAAPHVTRVGVVVRRGGSVDVAALSEIEHLFLLHVPGARVGTAEVVRLAERHRNLEALDLAANPVGDQAFGPTASLQRLRSIDLSGTEVTVDTIEKLALLPSLETLRLDVLRRWVGDAALAHLARAGALRTLSLYNTGVTDAGLASLRGHPSLRRIELMNNSITDAGLGHLATLPDLREVGLYGASITADGLGELAAMRSLRRVDLTHTPVDDAGLARLSRAPAITAIELHWNTVGDTGIASLGALSTLRALEAESAAATGPGFAGLRGLTGLRALHTPPDLDAGGVRNVAALVGLERLALAGSVDDAGLAALSTLTGLRSLEIEECRVTNRGAAQLAAFIALENLRLVGCPFGDEALAAIGGLTRLRALDLAQTQVTSAGLAALAELVELEHLNLDSTRVDDAGVARLAALPRLAQLGLGHTRVTGAAIADLERLAALEEVALPGGVDPGAAAELDARVAHLDAYVVDGEDAHEE